MQKVLYGFTPEIFATKDRGIIHFSIQNTFILTDYLLGTGNALTATANRVFGIMAPIIAMFADLNTSAPVYTSGALFIAAGLAVAALPFETQGKASL
jgi:hypothetical protein